MTWALFHQIVTVPANCGQSLLAIGGRQTKKHWIKKLSYKMIAERDSEKVKVERQSSLIIVAKARVFASAGWQVVITDKEGKSYAPSEFDQLLAA